MRHDDGLAASASPSPLAAASTASVGPALRALRVARGLTLDDVSTRLKFSARQISALEEERWGDLPNGISLRGLVRNYARLLDADPQALTAALEPYIAGGAAGLAGSIATPMSAEPVDRQGSGAGFWILLLLVAAVVLAGLAYWQGWVPAQWLSSIGFTKTPTDG